MTFITEKREQNSSAGSCGDREELPWISPSHFLSLSWFSSLCGKGVWKVAFFSTVLFCASNSPRDSDNDRTYYMLRVMAVVRAVRRETSGFPTEPFWHKATRIRESKMP